MADTELPDYDRHMYEQYMELMRSAEKENRERMADGEFGHRGPYDCPVCGHELPAAAKRDRCPKCGIVFLDADEDPMKSILQEWGMHNWSEADLPRLEAEFAPDERKALKDLADAIMAESDREDEIFRLVVSPYLRPISNKREFLRHRLHDNGWNWTGDREWTW